MIKTLMFIRIVGKTHFPGAFLFIQFILLVVEENFFSFPLICLDGLIIKLTEDRRTGEKLNFVHMGTPKIEGSLPLRQLRCV